MTNKERRQFLTTGVLGGAGSWFHLHVAHADTPRVLSTPGEIEGPFYPITPQKDKDFDLTHVAGRRDAAKGKVIEVSGAVVDKTGLPIEDATVEIWQANAAGRYAHPHDSNPAPLDPNFQGWATVLSGKKGGFRFRTVMPGSYPASSSWDRPPHIHFKVTKRGFSELITQMYFPGHPLNKKDRLLIRKSPAEQKLMIAEGVASDDTVYRYKIILEKV